MERNENIYELLSEYLDISEGGINVMEAHIDSDVQLEYFEYSKNNLAIHTNEEIIRDKEQIFMHDISIDRKKNLLIQLASLDNVEAYRTIERYLKDPNSKLYDWAYLAFMESRLLLESKFLEESKVLITTGLGGKGNKLRYFIVFFTCDGTPLTPLHQKIIKNELDYNFKKIDAEVEDIIFEEGFASILSFIPINISVQYLFDKIIRECNEFGNFLFNDYIITNVKVLSIDEVREMLAINNIL